MTYGDGPDVSALIARATSGDENALRQLLFIYHGKLTAAVQPMIGEKLRVDVGVEDILQDTFVAAYKEIGSFRTQDEASFFAWLRAIAANRIRDAARRQGRKKRGGDLIRMDNPSQKRNSAAFDLLVEVSGGGTSPSGVAARDEALDAIRIGIAALPKDQRQAIMLHCIDGLTLEETAKQMQRSWHSVRGLIQRGKQALREHMQHTSMWFSKQ